MIIMSFKVGIVGLPNVGKSTLFKALTKKQILIANYPFATIDPNVGVVEVPDERLAKLAQVSKSDKIIPTTIEFYDIAGLVAGAYKGEGLGNQFLANIREVDAIAHVVRVFADTNIIHVHGKPDPKNDIEIINLELCMADLKTVERRHGEVVAKAKSGEGESIKLRDLLDVVKDGLNKGIWARETLKDADSQLAVRDLHLLTMKPMLYVFNTDEDRISAPHPTLSPEGRGEYSLVAGIKGEGVAISAKIEAELAELPDAEAREMMKGLGMNESGLEKLIKASYKLLDLITFLTSGPKETRAWTVKRGTKAPQAAGVIHSDFEKGFIRVEIIDWNDFIACAGESGAKEKGLMRVEGKDYIIQDGDVCYFRVAT